MRVAKTKELTSFAITAKLICAFVFAYADCWFSHAAAQLIKRVTDDFTFSLRKHLHAIYRFFLGCKN